MHIDNEILHSLCYTLSKARKDNAGQNSCEKQTYFKLFIITKSEEYNKKIRFAIPQKLNVNNCFCNELLKK